MTPEGKIKAAVKKRLNFIGAYHFWPVQMGMGSATLDCLGSWRGRFFAIETKAPGKKPTARQLVVMDEIRRAKGHVFVIDNVEDAEKLFAWNSDGF